MSFEPLELQPLTLPHPLPCHTPYLAPPLALPHLTLLLHPSFATAPLALLLHPVTLLSIPLPGGDGYCGKMRSKSLSGANFVCYDGGHKPGEQNRQGRAATGQPRRQMAAVVFNKASSRRAPMSMRVLTPSVELAGTAGTAGLELLDTLQALAPDGSALPGGTELLRLVPPRWNDQGQMFQLSYEGRACCMSNKNVQLANVADESSPTLQARAPAHHAATPTFCVQNQTCP